MGVPFKHNEPIITAYKCSHCHMYLTTQMHLSSKTFSMSCSQGTLTPGWLFKKVENVTHSDTHRTHFSTGEHIIRHASCSGCGKFLGWYYEFAYEKSERYKESQTLLSIKDISYGEPYFPDPLEVENNRNYL